MITSKHYKFEGEISATGIASNHTFCRSFCGLSVSSSDEISLETFKSFANRYCKINLPQLLPLSWSSSETTDNQVLILVARLMSKQIYLIPFTRTCYFQLVKRSLPLSRLSHNTSSVGLVVCGGTMLKVFWNSKLRDWLKMIFTGTVSLNVFGLLPQDLGIYLDGQPAVISVVLSVCLFSGNI